MTITFRPDGTDYRGQPRQAVIIDGQEQGHVIKGRHRTPALDGSGRICVGHYERGCWHSYDRTGHRATTAYNPPKTRAAAVQQLIDHLNRGH